MDSERASLSGNKNEANYTSAPFRMAAKREIIELEMSESDMESNPRKLVNFMDTGFNKAYADQQRLEEDSNPLD